MGERGKVLSPPSRNLPQREKEQTSTHQPSLFPKAPLREIREADAESFLGLRDSLDRETDNFSWEPGERLMTEAGQSLWIRRILAKANSRAWVLEGQGELAGFLSALGGETQRTRHKAVITVGLLKKYWGRGWAGELFSASEAWARRRGLQRLELGVMDHNQRALKLYERLGFVREGLRPQAYRIRGAWVSEIIMGKIL